jgi:hypothetical protein
VTRLWPYLGVALPPLALAAVGVTHPTDLTMASSTYWRDLHVATLFVFPLLGISPWLVVRGGARWITWTAAVLGFGYAALYTALDVLSGIGAGGMEMADMAASSDTRVATGTLFHLGTALGALGSYFFIAACAFAGGVAFWRHGWRTLLGTVIVLVGTLLFLERHIYFPVGVLGQLCLAVGWVLVLVAIWRATPKQSAV